MMTHCINLILHTSSNSLGLTSTLSRATTLPVKCISFAHPPPLAYIAVLSNVKDLFLSMHYSMYSQFCAWGRDVLRNSAFSSALAY